MDGVAWAAGLFEGEGCIHISRRGGKLPEVWLSLCMTDEDVVDKLHRMFPGGTVKFRDRSPHKDIYDWRLMRRNLVAGFLQMVRPYLGKRRGNKADEALEIIDRLMNYCRHGHPWTPENTYHCPKRPEVKYCRSCNRRRNKQSYERSRHLKPPYVVPT